MKGLEALENNGHLNDDEQVDRSEQFVTDLALLKHRQAHPVLEGAVSSEWCDECGDEIPEARRAALPGVLMCVECQSVWERENKHG